MRILKIVILSFFALIVIYFLGPKPSTPVFNNELPTVASINSLDAYITAMEAPHKIKPNNEAKIIWADSSKTQTEYAIVYLHGFSASQMEGDPVHQNIARQFHCNLYLARLAEHGIDTTEDLMNLTAEKVLGICKTSLRYWKTNWQESDFNEYFYWGYISIAISS